MDAEDDMMAAMALVKKGRIGESAMRFGAS
jgi:hypothetical protein